MSGPRAVRWAHRRVRGELEWTKWHYTEDGNFTRCFRLIPAITEISMLPESHDPDRVDCGQCRRRLAALEATQ